MLCGSAAFAQTEGVSQPTAGDERNDLAAGAAHLVATPVNGGDFTPRPAASAAKSGPPGKGNPLWAIPLDSLHATRERPLFSASRRPPPAPVAQAEPVAAPPPPPPAAAPEQPQLILVGVVHGGKQDIGVFIDQNGQSVLRLRVGQQQNGWIVHSVDLRAATLAEREPASEAGAARPQCIAPSPRGRRSPLSRQPVRLPDSPETAGQQLEQAQAAKSPASMRN